MLQGEHATKGLLAEMTRTQQDLQQYAKDASAAAEAGGQPPGQGHGAEGDQEQDRRRREAGVPAPDVAQRLARLEEEAAYTAQTAWLSSGVLAGEISGKASEQGKKAVKFATGQIGKPYEWGAEGPARTISLGLTSQAWAAAGHGIPRTSQEQWEAASPCRRQGHAPRRPDHLFRRRQPCGDVHRRRRDRARAAAGPGR